MFNTFTFTVIHTIYTLEGFHPISKVFQTFRKIKFPGKTIYTAKHNSHIIGIKLKQKACLQTQKQSWETFRFTVLFFKDNYTYILSPQFKVFTINLNNHKGVLVFFSLLPISL